MNGALLSRADLRRLDALQVPSTSMVSKLLGLAAAGAVGTVARVLLSTWVQRLVRVDLPLGTAVVNVLGCFLFGIAFASFEGRLAHLSGYRLIVLAGFMGGFTTFSSYMFDTERLLEQGRAALAFANLGAQNALGMLGLWLGLRIGLWSAQAS
jgi:fluoride exporter